VAVAVLLARLCRHSMASFMSLPSLSPLLSSLAASRSMLDSPSPARPTLYRCTMPSSADSQQRRIHDVEWHIPSSHPANQVTHDWLFCFWTDSTDSYHFFWAHRFVKFFQIIFLFFVLCVRLNWITVDFWAHVLSIRYRIVSHPEGVLGRWELNQHINDQQWRIKMPPTFG